MRERPEGLTIERINNEGNYEPNNCKWATQTEQIRNSRTAKLTVEKVRKIRRLYRAGLTQDKIAKLFDVVQVTISSIVRRKTWIEV